MQDIVDIKNLSLIYQSVKYETTALLNINLSIKQQEFISIVGPSGCGKTTILSLISGLIKPTNGEIKILGKEPSLKDNISGYMFQRDNLLRFQKFVRSLPAAVRQNADWSDDGQR